MENHIQVSWSLEWLDVLDVVEAELGDLAQDLEVADDAEPAVEEEG